MNGKTEHLKLSEKICAIDPVSPQTDLIRQAADRILRGGVVVFPTTGLYGLGADALNAQAISKIFSMKGRSKAKPILVLISGIDMLEPLVSHVPPAARKIMETFWPGGVTIVLEAVPGLPANLTAGTGKIGVRMPAHPVAAALVRATGIPITGTSANISGAGGCSSVSGIDPALAERVDMILNAGPLRGGAGSTVVDASSGRIHVLREGAVPAEEIFAALAQ